MSGEGRDRNPRILFRAIAQVLESLTRGGQAIDALQGSWDLAMAGLGAQKGVLLYVRESDPVELEILHASGLTADQQEACVRMESSEGVSPSVIRQVMQRLEPVFIPNSADAAGGAQTTSLSGAVHSVLCAPIIDGATNRPIAVLYYQSEGLLQSFEPEDYEWLVAFSAALSQGLGLHLARQRRLADLERAADRSAPVIVGDSTWTEGLIRSLREVYVPATANKTPRPILILGDSGTGKELVARYLHYFSPRHQAPMQVVNCAELTRELATSRLFGHKRGSFTGAVTDELGYFRSAHRGTLFLDEIGELPLEAQAILLRVLDTPEVQPLGDPHSYKVDVQLVLATNRDLVRMASEGTFRRDLYARISGLRIRLVPLADSARRSDVRPLLSHFLSRAEGLYRKKTGGLTPEAYNALLGYSWPLNVREIAGVCEGLVAHAREGVRIDVSDIQRHYPEVFDSQVDGAETYLSDTMTYEEARVSFMRELIRRRIELHGGNMTATAESLGIPPNRLLRYREKAGLHMPKRDDASA